MRIALIALDYGQDAAVEPPLPLAYLAALLEQQRQIVRIYDLALNSQQDPEVLLDSLRGFRAQVILLAAAEMPSATAISLLFRDLHVPMLYLGNSMRSFAGELASAYLLWSIADLPLSEDEQIVIRECLQKLAEPLDALPFPARHLLLLDEYPLYTLQSQRYTTVLVGQVSNGALVYREPMLVLAEMQGIMREFGIYHFSLAYPQITGNVEWLQKLLYHFQQASPAFTWEALVDYRQLNDALIGQCYASGAVMLWFECDAETVLESQAERIVLVSLVDTAHRYHLATGALLHLRPPYTVLGEIIDVSASFGLDAVRFQVEASQPRGVFDMQRQNEAKQMATLAQKHYPERLSRQRFISRFGPSLGPMLWRAGCAGLLGRNWQRVADNKADRSPV